MSERGELCWALNDVSKAPAAWKVKYDALYPRNLFPLPYTIGQLTARCIAVDEALCQQMRELANKGAGS